MHPKKNENSVGFSENLDVEAQKHRSTFVRFRHSIHTVGNEGWMVFDGAIYASVLGDSRQPLIGDEECSWLWFMYCELEAIQ